MKLIDISKQLNSALEARILVQHVTGLSDADLITMDDIPLNDEQAMLLNDFIQQRLNGRPVSKIMGLKEFYGRDFIVSDDVLDPRPDSELIIDLVLKYEGQKTRVLDLGTGSGCLILTLLSELRNATGVAADISPKALNIAKQNADKLNVTGRIAFIESDWLESVEGEFDIIISNPPYITPEVIAQLDVDVSKYDPVLALDGGEDGLLPYKVILPQIRTYLKKGGMMAMEHGYDQGSSVHRIAVNAGLSDVQTHKDLGGLDRVITATHK